MDFKIERLLEVCSDYELRQIITGCNVLLDKRESLRLKSPETLIEDIFNKGHRHKRIINTLRGAGVDKISDLKNFMRKDVLRWRNFGKLLLQDLEEEMKRHSVNFKDEIR